MNTGRLLVCLVVAPLLSLTGCAAAPSVDLSVTRLAGSSQPFGISSGFTQPANVVVRDGAGWQALWATIHAGTAPPPPLPDVDFGRHLVVARAMGPRPTGGFTVAITGMLRQGGEYVVQVRETSPGTGCAVTLAETSPVDVALIGRHDASIKFAIAAETRTCGRATGSGLELQHFSTGMAKCCNSRPDPFMFSAAIPRGSAAEPGQASNRR